MNSSIIDIKNLVVSFNGFKAVDDVSFSVNAGEIFGFLGANGAGKTTTIRVICGLLLPESGKVQVAGIDTTQGMDEIKKRVGYMSQRFTLYDDLTVQENMRFKADLRGISADTLRIKTEKLFSFIGFTYSPTTLVRDLPSGIKQQISLIATLLHDPDIIILDEPTSGVSPAVRVRFWKLINTLAQDGKTVIVTTHYMDEAEQCGRIALMRTGKIIALDTPGKLKKNAYSAPLIELSLPEHNKEDITGKLISSGSIETVWPYGLTYHAAARQGTTLSDVLRILPPEVNAREIQPSMEDVFVRLIEGGDR